MFGLLMITQEFMPVAPAAREVLPAAPLVLTAYGFAWLVVFFYIWSIARRLDHVERDIAGAARQLAERRH
jgi:CcmD family protein